MVSEESSWFWSASPRRTFHAKPLPVALLAAVLLPMGTWITTDALIAGYVDSFWGTVSTNRREYPIPLLLLSGIVLTLLGVAKVWAFLAKTQYVTIDRNGIRVAPYMKTPIAWDKISRIEVIPARLIFRRFYLRRLFLIRKDWIIITVPNGARDISTGWLGRIVAWSPSPERPIRIYPPYYENGDEILDEIERYHPVVRS